MTVVVIGGAETGLLNTSRNTSGVANELDGTSGDTGGDLHVNVASGNAIYRQLDAFLASTGEDFSLIRTYNVRGELSDDGVFGASRWTLGGLASVRERTEYVDQQADAGLGFGGYQSSSRQVYYEVVFGDGSIYDFRWNAASGQYICTDGAGSYHVLEKGSDGRFSVRLGDGSQLSFDAQGRLTQRADGNGIAIDYEYDANGLLLEIRDDTSHVLTFAYTGGRLTSVTRQASAFGEIAQDDVAIVLATYGYDGNGRLSEVTDRRGDVTRYTYTDDGYLETIELPGLPGASGSTNDGLGFGGSSAPSNDVQRVIRFEYLRMPWTGGSAGEGRLLSKLIDAEGQATLFDYSFEVGEAESGLGQLYNRGSTTVTDYLGNSSTYRYDARGNITEVLDQLGFYSHYSYDEQDNLLSVTDRNGWGITNSDSSYYRDFRERLGYTRELDGFLMSATAQSDILALRELFTSHFEYDARGNLLKRTDNSGDVTEYAYDDADNLIAETSALGWGVVNSDADEFRALRLSLGYTQDDGSGELVGRDKDALSSAEKAELKALFTTRYEYDNPETPDNDESSRRNLLQVFDGSGDITEFGYDAFGNLATETRYTTAPTDPDYDAARHKQVTTYEYDVLGNNTRITDANGFYSSAEYDVYGNVLSRTSANYSGLVRTDLTPDEKLYWDGLRDELLGFVGTVPGDASSLKDRYTTRYTYDGDNRLRTVTDPERGVTTYAYDGVGNQISVTNTQGHTVTSIYDKNNRLISTLDPADSGSGDRRTTLVYTAAGNLEVTDVLGSTTTYVFNARREVLEVITPEVVGEDGSTLVRYTTTFAYDGEGNRVTLTDNRGNPTHYAYDEDGLVVREENAEGHVIAYSYDANSNLLRVVAGAQLAADARQTRRYVYDAEDRLVEEIDAEGFSTHYAYDGLGNLHQIINARGDITDFEYDLVNRLVTERLAAVDDPANPGGSIRYTVLHTFDANGNEVATTNENGNTTRFSFDGSDRVVTAIDALGTETRFEYDGEDNTLSIKVQDAVATVPARHTRYEYDEFNQLVAETDAVGNALIASDDLQYQRLRQELGYSALAAQLSDADKAAIERAFTTRYNYDAAGNQVSVLAAGSGYWGRSIARYDALGRVIAQLSATGTLTTYSYDGNGNEVEARVYRGAYRLNASGAIPPPDAGDTYSSTTTSYDLLNRRLQFTVVDAVYGDQANQRTYDTFGNLRSSTDGPNSGSERRIEYSYDANNRLISTTDALGSVTELMLDAVGNIVSRAEARGKPEQRVTAYAYDALGRLSSETNARAVTTHYQYDAVGNLTEEKIVGPLAEVLSVTNYEYDGENRLTAKIDPSHRKASYPDRNPSNPNYEFIRSRTEYDYDVLGNLSAIRYAVGELEAYTESFVYDSDNQLLESTDGEGVATQYSYDARGNVVRVIEAAGHASLERESIYEYDLANRLRARHEPAGTTRYFYDSENNVIAQQDPGGKVTQYSYNAVGQVVRSTSGEGNVSPDGIVSFDTPETYQRRTDNTYDSLGRLIKIQTGFAAAPESDGAVTGYSGRDIRTTRYDYDALNQIIALTDPEGFTTLFTYDAFGNKTSESSGRYLITESDPDYTYSATKAQVVEDRVKNYQYNEIGLLEQEIDPEGNKSTYSYDWLGYLQEVRQGLTTEVSDDLSAEGLITRYQYDAKGQLLRREVGQGTSNVLVETYEYDALGNIVLQREGNPSGTYAPENPQVVTTFAYSNTGNLTAKYRVGYRFEFAFEPEVTPDDVYEFYQYDALGRQIAVLEGATVPWQYQLPDDAVPTNEFSSALLDKWATAAFVQTTLNTGRLTRSVYDASDRLTLLVDPLLNNTRFDYDPAGNLVRSEQVELGIVQRLVYDVYNQVIAKIDAEGGYTAYAYDSAGNQLLEHRYANIQPQPLAAPDALALGYPSAPPEGAVHVVDGVSWVFDARLGQSGGWYVGGAPDTNEIEDRVSYFVFDGLNRLTQQVDPSGLKRVLNYDSVGNLLSQTESVDAATDGWDITSDELRAEIVSVWEYDLSDRLTYFYKPDGTVESYLYDSANNLIQTVVNSQELLATGVPEALKVTTTTYDAFGRITSQSTARNKTIFTFNQSGDVLTRTNARGETIRFEYDEFGRLAKKARIEDYRNRKLGRDGEVYFYNPYGELAAIYRPLGSTEDYDALPGYFLGRSTTYLYDVNGRLLEEKFSDGGRIYYRYDIAGNLVFTEDAAGYSSYYEYDGNGRLVAQVDGAGYATVYIYNAFGDVVETRIYSEPVSTSGFKNRDQDFSLGQDILSFLPTGDFVFSRITSEFNRAGKVTETAYNAVEHVRTLSRLEANATASQFGINAVAGDTATYDGLLWTFTEAGQWVSETVFESPKETVDYDARGNAVRSTNRNGAEAYAYFDVLGRLVGTVNGGYLITTAYDSQDNIVQQVNFATPLSSSSITVSRNLPSLLPDPDDVVVSRFYDEENQLVEEHSGWVETPLGRIQPITTYAYDAVGNMTRRTRAVGTDVEQTELYFYAAGSRLIGVYDVESQALSVTRYEASGRIAAREDIYQAIASSDQAAEIAERYDRYNTEDQNFLAVNWTNLLFNWGGSNNRSFSYAYDAVGRLTRESRYVAGNAYQADNSIHRFYSYDENGGLSSIRYGDLNEDGTLREGGTEYAETKTYNARKQLVKDIGASGLTRHFEYNASGQVIKSWKGNQFTAFEQSLDYTWFEYNAVGVLVKTNAGDGLWREFLVDAYGNKIQENTYGLRLASETDLAAFKAASASATYAQNADSEDNYSLGVIVKHFRYDALGSNVVATDGLGQQTVYTHDYAGRTTSVTDPKGGITVSLYDGAGNLRLERQPEGGDAIAGFVHAESPEIRHYYNAIGGRTQSTYAGVGKTQIWDYDDRGNMVRHYWSGLFATTKKSFAYDRFNRLVRTEKGNGLEVIQLTYDNDNRISTLTNMGANQGSETTTRLYDTRGNNTWTIDGNGHLFGREFDAANLVTEEFSFSSIYWKRTGGTVTDPSYSLKDTSFDMSSSGASGITGIASIADLDTRIERQDWAAIPTVNGEQRAYIYTRSSYDIYGNRTSEDVSGTSTTIFSYGEFGRLETRTTTDNGLVSEVMSYDRFNREILRSRNVAFDGNKTSSNEKYQRWDAANQLLSVTSDGVNTAGREDYASTLYTYDANGNRSSEKVIIYASELNANFNVRDIEYLYSARGDLVRWEDKSQRDSVNGTMVVHQATISYDAWGNKIRVEQTDSRNPTQVGGIHYEYDLANRVILESSYLSVDDTSAPVSVKTLQFTYDQAGRRATQTRTELAFPFDYNTIGTSLLSGDPQTKQVEIKTTTFYRYWGNGALKDVTTQVPKTSNNDRSLYFVINQTQFFETVDKSPQVPEVQVTEHAYLYDRAGNVATSYDNPLRDGEVAYLMGKGAYWLRFDDEGKFNESFAERAGWDYFEFATGFGDAWDFEDISWDIFVKVNRTQYLRDQSNRVHETTSRAVVSTLFIPDLQDATKRVSWAGVIKPAGFWQTGLRAGHSSINDLICKTRDTFGEGDALGFDKTYNAYAGAARTSQYGTVNVDGDGDLGNYNLYEDYSYRAGLLRSSSVSNDSGEAGSSVLTYDSAGNLITSNSGAIEEGGLPGTGRYYHDNNGRIVQSDVYTPDASDDDDNYTYTASRFLYALGNPVGSFAVQLGAKDYVGIREGTSASPRNMSKYDTVREIGSDAPSTTQQVVSSGASLRELARQYYGSPDLWYVIAEANGVNGDGPIKAGTRITIPGTTANAYHNSETHVIYNEGDITGSLLPNVVKDDNTCALIVAIILIVVIVIVAIVATVLTAGVGAPAAVGGAVSASAALVGVAKAVAVGAAIAFAASVATQGVLVGTGLQKDWDWNAVLAETLTGSLGALAGGGAISAVGRIGRLARTAASLGSTAKKLLPVAKVAGRILLESALEAASQAITNKGKAIEPWSVVAAGVAEGLGDAVDAAKTASKAAISSLRRGRKSTDIADDAANLFNLSDKGIKKARRQKRAVVEFEFMGGRIKDKGEKKIRLKEADIESVRLQSSSGSVELQDPRAGEALYFLRDAASDRVASSVAQGLRDGVQSVNQKFDVNSFDFAFNSLLDEFSGGTFVNAAKKAAQQRRGGLGRRIYDAFGDGFRDLFQDTMGFKAIGRALSRDFKNTGIQVDNAEFVLRAAGKIQTKAQKYGLIGLKFAASLARYQVEQAYGTQDDTLNFGGFRGGNLNLISLATEASTVAYEISQRNSEDDS